jgi:menaquinone-dependent protoporphyrinogen oxidase
VGEAPRVPKAAEDVCNVDDILAATNAAGHRLFSGKLDRSKLGFPERAVMRAVGAQEGDYRNWDEIEAWASEIAAQIGPRSTRIATPEEG